MSLDVYLLSDTAVKKKGSGIFVREDGATKEISRSEWDEKFPGREPVVVDRDDESYELYSRNITHNLHRMAAEACLYDTLWRPEEMGLNYARQLIPLLEHGLGCLEKDPEHYKKFNSSNGWGTYDNLVLFVKDYLEACREFPDAIVRVSR